MEQLPINRHLFSIEQLKSGDRLVMPVGESYLHQKLELVEKTEDGKLKIKEIIGVAFAPFRGEHEK